MSTPLWLEIFTDFHHRFGGDDFLYNIRPRNQNGVHSKKAAVLVLLRDGNKAPEVLITLRSASLRAHSGQPSFPGGAIERDESAREAAIRESKEEVGLNPESIEILSEFPALFIPPSNFLVTAFLGFWRSPHNLTPESSGEVMRAEFIPLGDLAKPGNRIMLRHQSGYLGPAFEIAGMRIWGFTGGILDRILHYSGFEQEWDRESIVDLEL